MSGKVRDLIRNVRLCKTASEERGLIHKECAAIRQQFKEGRVKYHSRNMLKLLYIAMLGYATEFGQMEVVKLLAQSEYGDKRIGYLTLAVLMDETHEVLTLAENHIKKDLSNNNPFIQSLALDVVANIAGEDMSRDVLHEVQNLVDSSNVHLKKKACLAGLRIVRKVPDYSEIFLGKLQNCFSERNHGALLCSLALVNECLSTESGNEALPQYRQQITSAVRILKQLVLSSHAMEHDVNGVADPFLQVKILEFLRIAGTGSDAASEAMNDVLAQVATNTDGSKNVGCAIQYECVRAINKINADDGLRLLGINTIGKFLLSSQNNTRFVALSTLLHIMQYDIAAVQRHQSTIIDCLKDADVSIKRRALELTVAMIDATNVRVLVPDLLVYLDSCDNEIKPDLVSQLSTVIEKTAPGSEWRIQTSLQLFSKGLHHVPDAFAVNFVGLVSRQPALQAEVVKSLWEDLTTSPESTLQSRTAFLSAALWCVGEYCLHLQNAGTGAAQLCSFLGTVSFDSDDLGVKLHTLTALAKLCVRIPACESQAQQILGQHAASLNCEVQQRATEYLTLIQSPLGKVAFAPMPEFPEISVAVRQGIEQVVVSNENAETKPQAQAKSSNDLDDLFGPSAPTSQQSQPKSVTAPSPTSAVDDLFGTTPAPAVKPTAASEVASFDIFSNADVGVTGQASGAEAKKKVDIQISRKSSPIDNVSFFVAVPKSCTAVVQPLATNSINSSRPLLQTVEISTVDGSKLQNLMMRIKLVYFVAGVQKTELFTVEKGF